jgi:hypothetical protein
MKQSASKPVQEKRSPKKSAKSAFEDLPLSLDDYKWIALGAILVFIGYGLMSGGGTDDPTVFAGDSLFSFRRMTLAPLTILGGMAVILYGIMKKSKEDKEEKTPQ